MTFVPPTEAPYPLTFSVEYPDRSLNRLTTFFRLIMVIPIAIVFGAIVGGGSSGDYNGSSATWSAGATGTGLLFIPPLLMLLFRGKYPAWWLAWNRELLRFGNRVGAYVLLMDDRYPSTDEQQSVQLDFADPDVSRLNRGLPLVKWFLAIPHYVVLWFLAIGAFFVVIYAWFAILFTGRYPRGAFDYLEGVMRWGNRVTAYAFILITDQYPPFRLRA